MPKFSLNPFTDLIDKKFNFTVEINQNDQAFFISYLITGDLTAINWGSLSPMKKRIIKLWEKTCFELFIKNERNEYIEFNFSPAFEWNCFYFKKPGDPLLEWEKMLRPNTDILLSLDKFFLFAEIKKEYPDADVFRFDGARVVSLENNIVYGKTFHGEAPRLTEAPTQTIDSELTSEGRQLLSRIRTACEKGSLGAWIDRLLAEDYDALVVFSDFQDGVRIYEEGSKGAPSLIYSDSNYHKVGSVMPVKSWQGKWIESFKKGNAGQGPKLYLFSIQQPPQGLLKACVEASGGNSISVSWLKSGQRPN